MDRGTFDDATRYLEGYHKYQLSDEARETYWRALGKDDDVRFSKAVQSSPERFKPGNFPTIGDLRRLISEQRETATEREKASIQVGIKRTLKASRVAHDCLPLLISFLEHGIDKRQFLAGVDDLHGKYPRLGFDGIAKQLREQWQI